LLPQGESCELYICWLGEEDEERADDIKIDLN
jgi:hypothetical protein